MEIDKSRRQRQSIAIDNVLGLVILQPTSGNGLNPPVQNGYIGGVRGPAGSVHHQHIANQEVKGLGLSPRRMTQEKNSQNGGKQHNAGEEQDSFAQDALILTAQFKRRQVNLI